MAQYSIWNIRSKRIGRRFIKFEPSLINQKFFSHYKDPSMINMGECFVWSYAAYLLFEDVELWDVHCHAFVRYCGLFYDSETLTGSCNWQDLPATKNSLTLPARYSVSEFKRNWKRNLKRYKTSWKQIESEAQRILSYE